MKDFVYAALPWVLMGLALAVFFYGMANKRQKSEDKKDYYGMGIALGAAAGIAIGTALNDVGLVAGLGMLIGAAADVIFSKK